VPKLHPKYTKEQIQKLYRSEGKSQSDAKRLAEILEVELKKVRRAERRVFKDARKHERNYGLDLDSLYHLHKEKKHAKRLRRHAR
jgi:hypothetical protein